MIRPEYFYNTLRGMGIDFYTGVPDSLLKDICAYITDHADRKNNIIAANEGGAVGLAAVIISPRATSPWCTCRTRDWETRSTRLCR